MEAAKDYWDIQQDDLVLLHPDGSAHLVVFAHPAYRLAERWKIETFEAGELIEPIAVPFELWPEGVMSY